MVEKRSIDPATVPEANKTEAPREAGRGRSGARGRNTAASGPAEALARARRYRQAGDLSRAEAVLEEALAAYPDDCLLQGQLAWLKLAEGDVVAAEHLARSVLRRRPRDTGALTALAEVFRRRRCYAEAEDCLRVAAAEAGDVFATARLAALYLETGNAAAAEEVLRQALVRHPRDPQLLASLARVHAARGDRDRAIALYEEAMELAPADEYIYKEYLALLTREEGEEASIRELGRLLRLPSRAANPHLWFLYGRQLYAVGRAAEALEAFRQVLRRRPDFRPALKFAGYCAGRLGLYGEAIAYLERALAAEPGDRHVRNSLQACYRRAGRLEEGIRFFGDLARRHPDCPYFWESARRLRLALEDGRQGR